MSSFKFIALVFYFGGNSIKVPLREKGGDKMEKEGEKTEKDEKSTSSSFTETHNLDVQFGPFLFEDVFGGIGDMLDEFTKDITLKF